MKGWVLFIATVIYYIAVITSTAEGKEMCPQENCLPSYQCEIPFRGPYRGCSRSTICCSVVKPRYRTHCRHYGGICMKSCNPRLQRPAVDCPNSVCCVLVRR